MEDKCVSLNCQNKKAQQIQVRFKMPTLQKRKVKTWTPQQDQLLFQLHERYPKKWNKISEMMKNRNQNQCLHRYRRLVQVGEHKKIWSSQEDKIVLDMVQKFGNNWKFIAAALKTKTGKQIRQRYINKLDPSIKRDEWSQTEDLKIIELYTKYGSRWSEISKGLPGRPENRIKNRFYSYIQKNYDIVVKDESSTPTNYMTHQSSYEVKPDGVFQRLINPNLIYVSTPLSNKNPRGFQDCDLFQNKQNKDASYFPKIQKTSSNRGCQSQRRQYDDQCFRSRQLQQINEPNEIAYSLNNQNNEDLLYFQED